MDAQTKRLLQVVFQEAHVVDIDFSQWGRFIRLVVSAGLVRDNFEGRGTLHCVDFIEPVNVNWSTGSWNFPLESTEQYYQWVIVELEVEKDEGLDTIRLSGVGPSPTMEVKCKSVVISEFDAAIVDAVNPSWNEPYGPLARPGFRELHALVVKKRTE